MDILSLENNIPNESSDKNAEDIIKHKQALYDAFKESIVKNKWFYITLVLCFVMLKQYGPSTTSYGMLVFSFLFILIFGHIVHRISHNIDFLKEYNKYKKNNVNEYVDVVLSWICNFFDFHRVIHHDSSINKKSGKIQ